MNASKNVVTCALCVYPPHEVRDRTRTLAIEGVWRHIQNSHGRPEFEGIGSNELRRMKAEQPPHEFVYRLPNFPSGDLFYLTSRP